MYVGTDIFMLTTTVPNDIVRDILKTHNITRVSLVIILIGLLKLLKSSL